MSYPDRNVTYIPRIGDVVRYDHGETALAMVTGPHAGGFMARQCMGGGRFIHPALFKPWQKADQADMATWWRCRWWREEVPVQGKPHIHASGDGRWRMYGATNCFGGRSVSFATTISDMTYHVRSGDNQPTPTKIQPMVPRHPLDPAYGDVYVEHPYQVPAR